MFFCFPNSFIKCSNFFKFLVLFCVNNWCNTNLFHSSNQLQFSPRACNVPASLYHVICCNLSRDKLTNYRATIFNFSHLSRYNLRKKKIAISLTGHHIMYMYLSFYLRRKWVLIFFLNKENDFMSLMDFLKLFYINIALYFYIVFLVVSACLYWMNVWGWSGNIFVNIFVES